MVGMRAIEIHFQEHFAGEPVEVRINGRPVAGFAATTRYQVGLARIEKLEIGEGEDVTVVVSGQAMRVPLAGDVDVYVVRLADGILSIEPARGAIGYA